MQQSRPKFFNHIIHTIAVDDILDENYDDEENVDWDNVDAKVTWNKTKKLRKNLTILCCFITVIATSSSSLAVQHGNFPGVTNC